MKTLNNSTELKPCRERHNNQVRKQRAWEAVTAREIDETLRTSTEMMFAGIAHYWRVKR